MLKAFLSIIQQPELPAGPVGARGRPWPELPGWVWLGWWRSGSRRGRQPACRGAGTAAWAWATTLLVFFPYVALLWVQPSPCLCSESVLQNRGARAARIPRTNMGCPGQARKGERAH